MTRRAEITAPAANVAKAANVRGLVSPTVANVASLAGGGPKPANAFAPWAADLDTAERLARLRALRAVVHLLTGWRGHALKDALWRSERDATALSDALAALDALAPLDRRRVLATYAALHREVRP